MLRALSLSIALSVLACAPSVALAQTGLFGPAVEIGANAGVGIPDVDPGDTRSVAGPQLTLHLSPRDALVFFGDVAASREYFGEFWERSHMFGVNYRRTLYESGRFSLGSVTGVGLSRHQVFTPEFVVPGRDGPSVTPSSLRSSYWPMFAFGVNLDQRLTDRLSAHVDAFAVGTENASELRIQTGFSVPLRPYSATRSATSLAYGTTPLRVGQKLWITGRGGSETSGVVTALDDSRIEVSTATGRVSFSRDEIGRLAVPDSLRNGTAIGAGVGAASLAGFVAFIAHALCEGDDCDTIGPTALGAAYGAAFGAVAGALIDSFRDSPQTIFPSDAGVRIDVEPSLGLHKAGARVNVSW